MKILQNRKYRGELALLLVTVMWGGTFTIVKESLNDASPMIFVAVRFSLAALLFAPFVIKDIARNQKDILAGIFLGVLIFLAFSSQTAGLQYTTATKSGFITGTLVVIIPIFQLIIERRPPTTGAIIGTILVFFGIVLLSTGESDIFTLLNDLGNNFNFGDLLTLICAVLFALHVVYLDILSKKHNLNVLVFFQMAVSAILGLITASLFDASGYQPYHFNLTGYLIFGLIYTAVFATVGATFFQTKYQKEVTPTKAGIIYSFEPIFAAIIAFFALNEKISNFGALGSFLIFSGLIIAELYDNRFKKQNG